LVGGMLIYGAFNLIQRSLVLIVAGASKGLHCAGALRGDAVFDPPSGCLAAPAAKSSDSKTNAATISVTPASWVR
jgi:hypothetical protein